MAACLTGAAGIPASCCPPFPWVSGTTSAHVDDFEEARRIMRRAFDRGVTHFDLANNYGPPPGSAEENVGRILVEDFACHRDELVISTKAGHDMWSGPYGMNGSRKHLLASLDQSLKRLRLNYVDIFYSHCPDPDTRLEETMSALATAVHSGKALYVGLSKYPLKRLKKAVKILKDMGIRCLIYQPPYSILQPRVEAEGILDWLLEEGIGCIVFSPLAQGMLTPKYLDGIPEGSRAARPEGFLKTEQVVAQQEKIRALGDLAAAHGMPLHHLAIRWALRSPRRHLRHHRRPHRAPARRHPRRARRPRTRTRPCWKPSMPSRPPNSCGRLRTEPASTKKGMCFRTCLFD